ncbi:hypothetical protein BAUCODRAFT_38936 [Baudoinia panamericana UAMH 10762]|uniref:Uncharacterized protein n=1 Tax=Baudoinia panamericana (strain UAMH 10762) TaxID=717646 RepID=M2LCU4_BAUPA|nr:uncharacterized protein BAUCODRAFT_38936 [Baudoinia panamericana UAMH 10762]EMC91797.1 hypothetical protein BAUCODRAFT_38936 [Baudoinia panamericana UAMH 10762]
MASHYYAAPHYLPNPTSLHNNHGGHHGRSRRGPRVSSQNAHRQYKPHRSPKEVQETTPAYNEYLQRLEAARSFEFDDDELFCPFHLLTEDDLHSIHSASSSDRGSLSSGSPDNSPLQTQVQPTQTPSFLLSSAPNTFNPAPTSNAGYQQHTSAHQHGQMKLHQPLAQRTRNAIPIVDPSTRSIASPPLSVSPARQMQQQYMPRRW